MFRFIDGLSLFLSFFFYKGLLILETETEGATGGVQ